MKILAVFDFDHTVIVENSDAVIIDLIGRDNVPKEIRNLHKKDGWTAFMQGIFELLQKKDNSKELITKTVENLVPIPGMPQLIKQLKNKQSDVIIVSDSNSYFIDKWLEKQNLKNDIDKVFTNPADFDSDGLLKISMYHFQDRCKLSTKNLCKGQILDEFVQQQKTQGIIYDKIIYCGDGLNDFCPILKLKEEDLACVRSGFKCVEMVEKAKRGEVFDQTKETHKVYAEVLVWKDGFDILEKVNGLFS